MSMRVGDDVASPRKPGKKTKKKKNEANASSEISNLTDALPNKMEDSSEQNKEDIINKMNKKRRLEDTEEDASKNKTRVERDKRRTSQTNADEDAGYNGGLKGENEEKNKRKKRKLEASEERDASKNEICAEGEEKSTLLTDADEDADAGFNNGGLKGEKHEKKRPKKSKKKDGSDLDNNNSENQIVEGQKGSDEIYQKERDEKKKRKKKNLEASEETDASKSEICTEGEEKRTLLADADEDVGYNGGFKAKGDEKKRIKNSKKKDGNGIVLSSSEIHSDNSNRENGAVEFQRSSEKEDISDVDNGEEVFRKRKKKGKMDEEYGIRTEKVEKKKKKKKKREKKNGVDDLGTGLHENVVGETGNESTIINNESSDLSKRHRTLDEDTRNRNEGKRKKLKSVENGPKEPKSKGKRKKLKSVENGPEEPKSKGKRKKLKSVENGPEEPKSKGKTKKVRFSGHVEIFPSSEDQSSGKERNQDKNLVRGKRFTLEEDQLVKEAVLNYIEQHGLGKEGLKMVLHCKSYREIRSCWKEIGLVLPYRPYSAIYYRAHVLFERGEKREWTSEEVELVRKLYAEYGPEWSKMGETLGKHRFHVKDTWRRIIKFPNLKSGHWSQEEYQGLFDSVNLDLRMKAFEEKKSKHGMLRDNISWTAISEKLSTRTDAVCCTKWYQQLTSSMVTQGEWADTDDYHLLIALFSLDACCIEDVDWDYLLEHRSGDVCRKRWNQMVRHLGQYANKSFVEQVDILSNRYCPEILEAREVWDSKPVVS